MIKFSINALVVCCLIFILNIFDAVATNIGISLGGKELSPIMSYIINHWGFLWFYFIKIADGFVACLLLFIFWNRSNFIRICGYTVVTVYGLLAIYHIINLV